MNVRYGILREERGAALIISILILAVLLVISMGLVKMTGTDIQISSNYKFYNEAFYNADEGIEITPGIILRSVENQPNLATLDEGAGYIKDTSDDNGNGIIYFMEEIMGLHNSDPDEAGTDPDISYTNSSGYEVNIDVDRTKVKPLPGASAEFSSRYEGVGSGSAGGVAIWYEIKSQGSGGSNSAATLQASYRCVERTGGCLQ
jgi:Tfp pilus assembly protein PilX